MDTASNSRKKCLFCGEMILAEAIKCRFCGEFVAKDAHASSGEVLGRQGRRSLTNPPYRSDVAEDVLLLVRPSLAAMANSFILGIVIIAVGIFAGFMMNDPSGVMVALGVGGLVVIWLGGKIVILKCISWRIGQDRIEYERGVLNRSMDNLDMFRVTDVRLHCTLMDRLWGIGTVEILSSDETHPVLLLEKIRNPRKAYDFLKRMSLVADQRRGVVHME
ncbi:MAG: PH domain-containing protein [Phycisphaerae bacterium]|nr:PH domain-containing protein [Phycisphaerae bacterium]